MKMTEMTNAEKALQEANPHRLFALMIAQTGSILSDMVTSLEDAGNPNREATMKAEWFKHLKVGLGSLAMACEELERKAEQDDAVDLIMCADRNADPKTIVVKMPEGN